MKKRFTLLALACGLFLLEGSATFSQPTVKKHLTKNVIGVRRANESDKTSWTKDDFVSDWTPSTGELSTVNEGLDLKAGQGMSVLKNITSSTQHLMLKLRDFEGQEQGDTGAIVEVKVNGTRIQPANYDTDVVTLDKNCGRELLAMYDLSKYADSEMDTIEINEISNYSSHCVITYATMGDFSSYSSQSTANYYWGRDYMKNWDGEMRHADGMNDFSNMADDNAWIKVGNTDDITEGLKLQKEASVSRYITVSSDACLMTIAVRNFGGADEDYAGGVSVNGTFLKALGDDKTYFTKKTSATYFEGAGDGCEVATMKSYDLSTYIGRKVFITIANLKCYAMGGNEDLVIGSVSFTKPITGKDSTYGTYDATYAKYHPTIPVGVAGPMTVYNEGLSFRTNDFAGGIAQQFDLTNVSLGKNFYVKTYWRSVVDQDVSTSFQKIVNGRLIDTVDVTLKDSGDNLVCVDFDLTDYIGDYANIALHIKSRNYRVVLTKMVYYTEGNALTPAMSFIPTSKIENDLTSTDGKFSVITNSTSNGYSDVNGATFATDGKTKVKFLSRNFSFNKENLSIVINAASISTQTDPAILKVYLGDELLGEKTFSTTAFETKNYLFTAKNASASEGDLKIVIDGAREVYFKSLKIYGTFTAKNDAIQNLVDKLTAIDTCTEHSQAASLRSAYEALSEDEKVLFAREQIVDQDENGTDISVSAMAKLEYMEHLERYLNSTETNNGTLVVLDNATTSIGVGAVIAFAGLVSVLGYYLISKKRNAN